MLASVAPASSGRFNVTANVAALGGFGWRCRALVLSSTGSGHHTSVSPTTPGITEVQSATTVGTTGAVFAGPASPIQVVCAASGVAVAFAVDLTAVRVSTVNGHAARPTHRPIANYVAKRPALRRPAARHARSQAHH